MSIDKPNITELTDALTEATKEANAARKVHGAESLAYRNAEFVRRTHERQLESAKHRAAERDRRNNMTPSEINDEVDRRWR